LASGHGKLGRNSAALFLAALLAIEASRRAVPEPSIIKIIISQSSKAIETQRPVVAPIDARSCGSSISIDEINKWQASW